MVLGALEAREAQGAELQVRLILPLGTTTTTTTQTMMRVEEDRREVVHEEEQEGQLEGAELLPEVGEVPIRLEMLLPLLGSVSRMMVS